jgi:aminoglycoside 3-N-acetyltransferase
MSIAAAWARSVKLTLKARLIALRASAVRRFLSYGESELLSALRRLGVRPDDDLMLHSAFAAQHGFRGSPEELTNAFIRAVGPRGNLLMVSLPYRGSSLQHLQRAKPFDVTRTPSMMGLVSEHFRRRPEVLRSLHPTHPVLARGADAAWYIQDHEKALFPCGPGTPFHKLVQRDAVVAFFNVPFATFTFFHHLEHLVSGELPFALYTDKPFEAPVIDRQGRPGIVITHVFAQEAIRRRRFDVLERALRRRSAIASVKVGNTRIEAIRVRAAVECLRVMSARGQYFYALDGAAAAGLADHASRGG